MSAAPREVFVSRLENARVFAWGVIVGALLVAALYYYIGAHS